MLISDLRREIEYILQDTVDPDHMIAVMNECLQEDLARVLRLETKATATLVDSETIVSYPSDIYEIILLKAQGNSQTKFQALRELPLTSEGQAGYTFFGGAIELKGLKKDNPYTLAIWYYRYPAKIDSLSDTPDMPAQFTHALKYYFLSKHHKHDSDFKAEHDWLQDYLAIKQQIEEAARRKKGLQKACRVRTAAWV